MRENQDSISKAYIVKAIIEIVVATNKIRRNKCGNVLLIYSFAFVSTSSLPHELQQVHSRWLAMF